MVVFRFLFWTWFAVSICILAYRLVRRVGRGSTGDTDPPASPAPTGSSPASSAAWGPGERSGSDEEAMTPTVPAPASSPPAAPPGGSVFDAVASRSPGDEAPGAEKRTSSARPIAEMLAGIAMPCDLVPLLDATPHPGALESVAFSTTGHTANEVGEALGAELRRLGLELRTVSATHVVACRESDEIDVAIHAAPATVDFAGVPAFPGARDGQVVVEIWRG